MLAPLLVQLLLPLVPLLLMLLTQLLTLLLTLLKLLPHLLLPSNHWLRKKSRPLVGFFIAQNMLSRDQATLPAAHSLVSSPSQISIQPKPSSWQAIVISTSSLCRALHSAA